MYQVVRLHWSQSDDERKSAVANFGTVDDPIPMPLDTVTEPGNTGRFQAASYSTMHTPPPPGIEVSVQDPWGKRGPDIP